MDIENTSNTFMLLWFINTDEVIFYNIYKMIAEYLRLYLELSGLLSIHH